MTVPYPWRRLSPGSADAADAEGPELSDGRAHVVETTEERLWGELSDGRSKAVPDVPVDELDALREELGMPAPSMRVDTDRPALDLEGRRSANRERPHAPRKARDLRPGLFMAMGFSAIAAGLGLAVAVEMGLVVTGPDAAEARRLAAHGALAAELSSAEDLVRTLDGPKAGTTPLEALLDDYRGAMEAERRDAAIQLADGLIARWNGDGRVPDPRLRRVEEALRAVRRAEMGAVNVP